jgi:hypothetical protein
LTDITESVQIDNPRFGFTERELWLINRYRIHTDYVDENIQITNISTNQEIVDAEHQLVLEAEDRLFSLSHPQFIY